jgi:hypothetical protein
MLMNLTDPDLQGARGSRRVLYSRWPYPWPPEDDWGPITTAALFFIVLAGLIVFGSTHLTDSKLHKAISPNP